MSSPPSPHLGARLHATLPGTGGQIGPQLTDFEVEELPAYLPSGEGEHLYVFVEKRGVAAGDLLRIVARAAGVPERDVGSAGMKDKHGVTRQWLSLPRGARPPQDWALPPELSVLQSSRHGNKLRTGHLRGNRFRVRLTGVPAEGVAAAQRLVEALRTTGFANYFGAQRFGRGAENLARAIDWLERGMPPLGPRTRFFRKLYPSVLQAEVFNRYATRRLALDPTRLLSGEVVRLEGAGSSFVVEDAAREQPRLDARDLHLTGPMPGPRMKAAQGAALELERAVLAELALSDAVLEALYSLVDGTRRDLLVRPVELEVQPSGAGLEVRFCLPPGAYATQLIAELTGSLPERELRD